MLMRKSSSFCVVLFSSVLLYGLYRRLCDSGAATPWILGGRAPKALGTRGSGLEDLRSVVTEREGIASLLFNFWLRTCSGKLSLCAQNFIRGPTTPLQCWINANRGPWQLFALAPLLTRDKDISQPATRVDTTYWQLFRPDINTAHFYFLLQKLCQISWLLTSWKIFSSSGGPLRPEARGICHI